MKEIGYLKGFAPDIPTKNPTPWFAFGCAFAQPEIKSGGAE